MKKLAFNVDELNVQSFPTVPQVGPRGTVVGAGEAAHLRGTRYTRCYAECGVCTYTNCNSNERTEIDCFC
ncbi:MAG TPA: hypothetical protein VF771_21770 [Longimicrobiaceae bacterium]